MELRSPGASSADDLYRIAETDEPSHVLAFSASLFGLMGKVPGQAAHAA